MLSLAERGDLGGMSFGFIIGEDGDTRDGNRRTLRAIGLREISTVSWQPACEGTIVNARAKTGSNATRFRLTLARRFLETVR